MEFEHFALNVPDPKAMAAWYVQHCRMRVARALDEPPFTHFLADESGRLVLEIYTNTDAPMPDYPAGHPQSFHFAFAEPDIVAVKDRLLAAGALLVEGLCLDDGSQIFMLRDPWGIPLQLCKRATPLA